VTDSWIVGGALRDELLDRPVRDVDIAVAGDPAAAAKALAAELSAPVFRLSEAFGAWRVIDKRSDRVYDFAPLQGESIEADLAKRDFTINAMARPIELGALAGEAIARGAEADTRRAEASTRRAESDAPGGGAADLVDPLGGAADLRARTLRVLGLHAYASDPLRTLRLARFAAELGFAPDPETERLTRAAAPRTAEAAGERVFAELRRLLLAGGAVEGLKLADRLGVLEAVLPELTALHGIEQSDYHHLDVYDHTLEVLARQIELEDRLDELFPDDAARIAGLLAQPLGDELSRGEALRFGALVHDVAKPATREVRADGRITFMGHDRLGEEMVHDLCRRLRTSERFARFLGGLTRHHLVLGFLVHDRPLDRAHVYRYLRRTAPVEVEVTLLSCADRLATRGRKSDEATAAHLELAGELMTAGLDWREQGPPRVPVRGDELAAELGIEPGPELGRLLRELEEAAYVGEAATREQAIELARRLRA
jgi:tRNA nucleotidyltransferase/poly(A) polymerase